MNYILFSPLEQFEFMTIGIIPEIVINNVNWLTDIDHSIYIQQIFAINYLTNINNSAAIITEGMSNIGIIESIASIQLIKNITANEILNGDIINTLFEEDVNLTTIHGIQLKSVFNHGHFSGIWLNVYNSAIIVLVIFVLSGIIFNIIGKNTKFFNIWNYLIDLFFSFLLQTFMSLADRRLLNYFPIFSVFFMVIFFSNLTALVPLSFCLTSNLWLTLTLSFSVWVGVTVLAIIVRGFGFFLGFIPSNVPAALKGFITVIEIISYLARAISLGVRIFANMLAGHSLVHILSDLVETCIISFNHISLKVFGIFPALILTFILFIEFGICFLQALVFVILTAIYLKEAFGFSSH